MTGKAWSMLLLGGGVALGSGLGALLMQQRPAPPATAGGVTASAIAAAVPGRAQSPAPLMEETAARHALLARLRSPDAARLEDVRVWRFGQADERAVCGTIASHEIPGNAARFVVRLVLPRGTDAGQPGPRPPLAIVEDGPGLVRPAPEAARRFCREAEPPGASPSPVIVAYGPGYAAEADAGGAVPAAAAEGGGAPLPRPRVLVQSAANMRTGPGGAVLAVMPHGRVLQVFERAPGGWVQVGEDEPIGWIHGSLLGAAPVTTAQP